MTDILKNVLNIAARIHDMQAAGTLAMAFFGIVLVFGLVNCILGYRLLRFWMMIFGFLMGAGAGFFGVYEAGVSDKTIYVVVMLIAGVILAVISFAIFKAGIFIIGAGIGLTVTIYLIHPTTSFTFFLCLLTGVGLGFLALRYEREVIIVGTSILGGILSGFATAKLTNMEEIPFGIIFSIGFAMVGMLIQFAINRLKYEDEDEEEELPERKKAERRRETEPAPRRKRAESGRGVREEAENSRRTSPKRRPAVYEEEPDTDFQEEDEAPKRVRQPGRKRRDAYEEYDQEDDLDYGVNGFDLENDDIPEDDPDAMEELLDEYSVDEDEVIEEYLEDYYGENKKKKKKNSASPYQRKTRK